MSEMKIKIYQGLEYPGYDSPVRKTEKGTAYLKDGPGVALIAQPQLHAHGLRPFLEGFDLDSTFLDSLSDDWHKLDPATLLAKLAGQGCYASFGEKRTKNSEAARYFENILESGHGSVLEHAHFSFFIWGVSRAATHELVRHRMANYSQLSQRYVGKEILRFVLHPALANEDLFMSFVKDIDHAAGRYKKVCNDLYAQQAAGIQILSGEQKRDLRKKVQQAARMTLPNSTESFLTMTANVRTWRHIFSMRANEHADLEIRELAYRIARILHYVSPVLFQDLSFEIAPDGTNVAYLTHNV